MTKYMIGENYHGYEKITVEDFDVTNAQDNLFIIVIDKSCDENVAKYYNFIRNALKKHNRIILIGVEDDNKSFNPLASLLITYEDYDIYKTPGKDALSADYLLKIEKRTPNFSEVQTYIGGSLTAYNDISMLLFGIQSIVEEGNEKALKSFLEEHMESFEGVITALNMMKKTCDVFNSNELINEVNSLKNEKQTLEDTIKDKDSTIENIKFDRDKNKVDAENLKRENEKLKSKVSDTSSSDASTEGSTIKTFKTINTHLLKDNKTKIVLYFKEISYVRYTNTLVTVLFDYIKRQKLKVKLMIYDTNSEMYSIYNPLRVVNGSNYLQDKNNIVHKVEKFVVSEPSQSIITDVLTSDMNFDVVIIYDRMHTLNDVVDGNLVTKYYVINSREEYDSIKDQLKIKDTSCIITNADSSINISKEWKVDGPREFLDIPTIEDFKKRAIQSDSFVFSRYKKQATTLTKEALLDKILAKSKIDTLYNKE